jgi:hypothetical protein
MLALPVALPAPTTVSAYHGTVAYSAYDRARGTFSLVVGDKVARVTARRVPFDVDRAFCRTSGRCETGTGVAYTGVDLAGTRIAVAREVGGIGDAGGTQLVLTTLGGRG